MVRLKITYETDQELNDILKIIKKKTVKTKIPENQKGRFRKAYIFIAETEKDFFAKKH